MRCLSIVVSLVALGACKGGRRTDGAALAELRIANEQLIVELMDRSCKRPVLSGPTTPGTATADLRALAEPSGELKRCLDAFREPNGRLPNGCELVDKAVAQAVVHEDACSPYRAANVDSDEGVLYVTAIGKAVRDRMGTLAHKGDVATAIRLGIDGVRVCQDFARGGASLVMGMLMVACQRIIGDALHEQISVAPPAILGELSSAMSLLVSSQPSMNEFLDGELSYIGGMIAANDPKTSVPDVARIKPIRREYIALQSVCGGSLTACRERIEKRQQAPVVNLLSDYLPKLAQGVARLVALRAHAEYRRLAADIGQCPDVDVFVGPLQRYLSTPALGYPLRASVGADRIELELDGWDVRQILTKKQESKVIAKITCHMARPPHQDSAP